MMAEIPSNKQRAQLAEELLKKTHDILYEGLSPLSPSTYNPKFKLEAGNYLVVNSEGKHSVMKYNIHWRFSSDNIVIVYHPRLSK